MIEETNEMTIGDDFAHVVKGIGIYNIKLESWMTIQLNDVQDTYLISKETSYPYLSLKIMDIGS